MSEITAKRQLMVAKRHLDALSLFIMNLTLFYTGASPSLDQELSMLRKLLSGKPDYDGATASMSHLNAVLKKDTKVFKKRNLDSVSHLQKALKTLVNKEGLTEEVKHEVDIFLASLDIDSSTLFNPLIQFEKALELYKKAIDNQLLATDGGSVSESEKSSRAGLHDSITQELKQLIAPFIKKNGSDMSLAEIHQKLIDGLDHEELLECCLVMIRFVIRDVVKEAAVTTKLIGDLHRSIVKVNDGIKDTIASSKSQFEERNKRSTSIQDQLTKIENVVLDNNQIDKLKKEAQSYLEKMNASITQADKADQVEQQKMLDLLLKMQIKIQTLEEQADKYKQKLIIQQANSLADTLTKLPNRLAYEQRIESEFKTHKKSSSPLAMAIIDIDHFKGINDKYGHSVGDKTLQIIAKHIKQHSSKTDFTARWGGEEFIVLYPNTSLEDAHQRLENVRNKIASLPFMFKGQRVTITISAGLSLVTAAVSIEAAFEKTDKFLYQAKNNGRNQVVFKEEL